MGGRFHQGFLWIRAFIAFIAAGVLTAGLLISLSDGRLSVCGGSLVSSTRVVTAAHCWSDGRHQASRFTVVLGSTTLFFGGTRLPTNNVTTHAEYNYSTLWNDIAIAAIPRVSTSYTIRPIALPPSSFNSTLVGRRAQVTGFGKTSDTAGITLQQSLRDVYVRLISNSTCAGVYGPAVYEGSLCSWDLGRGPCGGDSGGPLTIRVAGQPVLVGVVSFGSARGCQAGYPSGFTGIQYFLPWIQERL